MGGGVRWSGVELPQSTGHMVFEERTVHARVARLVSERGSPS